MGTTTIATTTNAAPFQYPGNKLVVKQPGANRYIALVKATTADNYVFYKSTDSGSTWAVVSTVVRTNIVDVGSILLDKYGWIIWAYRTNESSQDRIYIRVINAISGAAVSEYLLASPGNGGVAGATYSGLDVTSHYTSSGFQYVVVAVGTRIGSSQGVTLHAAYADNSGVYIPADGLISGTRRWLFTGAGSSRVGTSIDKEHNGDGYTSTNPHLWITFGRDSLYLVKVPWTGNGWSGPTGSTLVYASTADDTVVGRWDGSRLLMCAPDPNATSQVVVLERNRANSSTTTRHTPNHTTGVVRQATLAYNTANGNIRVFAVGTSTAVLYFIDYTRLTDTWGSWTTTGLTAILGAGVDNFGCKVSTHGDIKYACYTAKAAVNTLEYTSFSVSLAPSTPTWVTDGANVPTTTPDSGSAADVGAALVLNWLFTDADPGDTQLSYALSKQIGAGALAYWRASDSTWQVAEVQNTSGTSSVTLSSGWAAASDAAHVFKVKVWDSSSLQSGYSADLWLNPSAKVNPVITAPTAAQVLTTDHVTMTWTAGEQTQYRVRLFVTGGAVVYDSGWVLDTGTRSLLVPYTLANGTNWTLHLQTRNLEGLISTDQTVQFTVTFIPPMTPTTVATPLPASGVISVAITNPTPSGGAPALASQDLYRRVTGDGSNGIRVAAGLANNATYLDWAAVSGVSYDYRAVAVGVNGTSTTGVFTA